MEILSNYMLPSWLPCGKPNDKTCHYVTIAPSITAVATISFAFLVAFAKGQNVRAFLFGCGIAGSGYCVWLSCVFATQKALGETSEELKNTLDGYKVILSNIQDENTVYKEENQKLKVEVLTVHEAATQVQAALELAQKAVGDLQIEKSEINAANQTLKKQLAALEEVKNAISQRTEKQIESLQGVNDSLTGVQIAAQQDHKQLKSQIQVFQDKLQSLDETRKSIQDTGSDLEKKIGDQVDMLLRMGAKISAVFEAICVWKDAYNEKDKIIDQIQTKSDKLGEVSDKLIEREEKARKQQEEIDEVQAKRQQELQSLLQELSYYQGQRDTIKKDVEKLEAQVGKLENLEQSLDKKMQTLDRLIVTLSNMLQPEQLQEVNKIMLELRNQMQEQKRHSGIRQITGTNIHTFTTNK